MFTHIVHGRLRRKIFTINFVLLFTIIAPVYAVAQQHDSLTNTLFGRKYKPGDVYHYRLTTQSWQNGKQQSTTVAICELKVTADSAGVPYDEIKWISKKRNNCKGYYRQNNRDAAIKTISYFIAPFGQTTYPGY